MNTVATSLLAAARQGLDTLDAQLLLLQVLGRPHDRAWLRAHDSDPLAPDLLQQFEALCRRRLQGEPVAYLTGEKEFFGLQLAVDARVLVPRPDTETLVEWALELHPLGPAADGAVNAPPPLRVADLGTGSGAIALALKHARPPWQVWATDTCEAALAVARANAQRLQLALHFHQGAWMQGMGGRFGLIVSNPPYIAEDDAHLPALRHEPRSALVTAEDGLADLRCIVSEGAARLEPGGWLLLEHGHEQAPAVRELLAAAGFTAVQSRRDLAGIERCSGGRLP